MSIKAWITWGLQISFLQAAVIYLLFSERYSLALYLAIALFVIVLSHWVLELRQKQLHGITADTMTSIMITSAPIAMAVVDYDGRIIDTNNQFKGMFGYNRKEAQQLTLADVSDPEDLKIDLHFLEQVRSREIDEYSMKIKRYRRKDGSFFYGHLEVATVAGLSKRGVLGMVYDITPMIRAMDALKSKEEQLHRINVITSHQLKSPINRICVFTEMLQSLHAELPEETHKPIEFLSQESERVQVLLQHILVQEKWEQAISVRKPVNLHEIMEAVALELSLDSPISCGCPSPEVMGDYAMLYECIRNLVENAEKYRSSERELVIRTQCKTTDTHWVFSIIDNGIGISYGQEKKIFTEFFRLHSYYEIPGHGVGLSICKTIMEKHGGTIDAKNNSEVGACFSLSFPIDCVRFKEPIEDHAG